MRGLWRNQQAQPARLFYLGRANRWPQSRPVDLSEQFRLRLIGHVRGMWVETAFESPQLKRSRMMTEPFS